MKITIITRNLGSGGAERVISQLLSEWAKNSIQSSLIMIENTEDFYTIPDGTKVIRIGRKHRNPLINKLLTYYLIRKIVLNEKPDVVLSMPEEIGIYVIGALLCTKIPVVVSERNNPRVMPYKKFTRLLRKILYPFASGFIFQSNEAASFFPKRIRSRSVILPNPLDLNRIPSVYEGDHKKVIVAAGRFEKQKNFKLLIDAFSEIYLKYQDYKLVIYGDGTLRNELSSYAKQVIGDAGYLFPGKNSNLLADMIENEIFVLSSDYEGAPNVLIEAMACGMAVISTNYEPGGVDYIIDDGENGFIVPTGEKEILVQKIEQLINDKELQKKFRLNSTVIKEKFDSTIVSKQWLDYLMRLGE